MTGTWQKHSTLGKVVVKDHIYNISQMQQIQECNSQMPGTEQCYLSATRSLLDQHVTPPLPDVNVLRCVVTPHR
jgi:hypothetical protein